MIFLPLNVIVITVTCCLRACLNVYQAQLSWSWGLNLLSPSWLTSVSDESDFQLNQTDQVNRAIHARTLDLLICNYQANYFRVLLRFFLFLSVAGQNVRRWARREWFEIIWNRDGYRWEFEEDRIFARHGRRT